MAVASNISKYTINGVEIPVYPTSVVCSDNLVSKSWNNMYGEFVDIPVNLKAKVNWIFDIVPDSSNNELDSSGLEILYNEMIRQYIIDNKSRFFEINTYFPGVGFISGTFYLGTPTTFTSKDTYGPDGKINYWQVELHWIEVDGIRLNSPLTPAINNNILNINGHKIMTNKNTEIKDIV